MNIKLKNAKVTYKDGKLLLTDAPEMPVRQENIYSSVDAAFADREYTHEMELYQEALSKAPTWEIKLPRQEMSVQWHLAMWGITANAEQGKLYDLPTGYIYEFEERKQYFDSEGDFVIHKFAIFIPQQEKMKSNHTVMFIKRIDGRLYVTDSAERKTWFLIQNSEIVKETIDEGRVVGFYGKYDFTLSVHCDEYHAHEKSSCFIATIVNNLPQQEVKEESQTELWLIIKRGIINKQFGARATHQEVVTQWEVDFLNWFEKEIESKFILIRR